MTNPKIIKEQLYQIVDSFLVEAVDQEGNVRCLDKLNQDRHLAVENFEKLISELLERQKVETRSMIMGMDLEDKSRESDEYDKGRRSMQCEILNKIR